MDSINTDDQLVDTTGDMAKARYREIINYLKNGVYPASQRQVPRSFAMAVECQAVWSWREFLLNQLVGVWQCRIATFWNGMLELLANGLDGSFLVHCSGGRPGLPLITGLGMLNSAPE